FQFALFCNICARAKPPRNATVGVKDGEGPGEKPTILTVFASQREGIFPWLGGRKGNLNALDDAIDLIGMMHLLPAPSLHFLQGSSGVLIPAVVVPKDITLMVSHPGEL